jgi:hypothetical protein
MAKSQSCTELRTQAAMQIHTTAGRATLLIGRISPPHTLLGLACFNSKFASCFVSTSLDSRSSWKDYERLSACASCVLSNKFSSRTPELQMRKALFLSLAHCGRRVMRRALFILCTPPAWTKEVLEAEFYIHTRRVWSLSLSVGVYCIARASIIHYPGCCCYWDGWMGGSFSLNGWMPPRARTQKEFALLQSQ